MWKTTFIERVAIVLLVGGIGSVDAPGAAASASGPLEVHARLGVDAESPCGTLIHRGVQTALAGDRAGAEHRLAAATRLCPGDPVSWWELTGLRLWQPRWSEAQDQASPIVRLEPDDAHAWQLVATSRYLKGDLMGALDACNRAGEPRIDAIDVHGAERTRQSIVVRAAGLQRSDVLTREAVGRALRRLRELPVASNARLKYEPIDGGLANVDVFVDERKVVPSGWMAVATVGARALLLHEVRVDVAGPLGAGELESASWRWAANRPRVGLGLALPSPHWLPGVVSLDGLWERQSYDATPSSGGATLVREERRRVGLDLADWSTSRVRWQTGVALDRLREYDGLPANRRDRQSYLALESALDVRLAGDRVALAATAGWWTPFAAGDRFGTAGLLAAWRSTDDTAAPSWSAVTEIGVASRVAPLALWQGAGTGHGRSGLIRAHPLHSGGVVTGPVFGREVAHGSVEYVRPVVRTGAGSLSIAGFVDAARAWRRLSGLEPSPLYVDAGAGVRVHAPGLGGAIRIDVARGLRGGGTTLSASWGGAWPR